MPETLSHLEAGAVAAAAAVLRAGGTVVVPTDTVYGVAALPSVPGATDALFTLKGRWEGQPLAVLVADGAQARDLIDADGKVAALVDGWMSSHWPGPLTIVARRSSAARPLELGAGSEHTIGVRCPDHEFLRALAGEVGPIATTSANRSGDPTPTDAEGAAASLTGPVDLVIDGGTAGTVASTVIDLVADPPAVLRHGAVDPAELAGADFGSERTGKHP